MVFISAILFIICFLALIVSLFLFNLFTPVKRQIIQFSLVGLMFISFCIFSVSYNNRKSLKKFLPNEEIIKVYYCLSIKDKDGFAPEYLKTAYNVNTYEEKGIMYVKEVSDLYYSDFKNKLDGAYYKTNCELIGLNTYYICIQYENCYVLIGDAGVAKMYKGTYDFSHDNNGVRCIRKIKTKEFAFSNIFSSVRWYLKIDYIGGK